MFTPSAAFTEMVYGVTEAVAPVTVQVVDVEVQPVETVNPEGTVQV